jgi:hypothetical protein
VVRGPALPERREDIDARPRREQGGDRRISEPHGRHDGARRARDEVVHEESVDDREAGGHPDRERRPDERLGHRRCAGGHEPARHLGQLQVGRDEDVPGGQRVRRDRYR